MTLKTINKSGRENYVSPSVEVLDVMSEGVFCISNGGSKINPAGTEDWGEY
ncbi:MAG: hypothetical protein IJN52_09595 [Bacteroidales bacterium]|nr:hypothetical protein [Bacteroidales bacterium]